MERNRGPLLDDLIKINNRPSDNKLKKSVNGQF